MKKKIIIIAVIAIFALIVVFVAVKSASADRLDGTYILTDAAGTDSEMFKATSGEVKLVIDADNTGTLSMLGQTTAVAVNPDDMKISFDGGKNYSAYSVKDGKLTVENNGYKAVFKKK